MLPELDRDEILRYSRHLIVPEVGLGGQRKLKGASVLIIGTGGLGSPVSLYLAAAGIGHIGLVDYDQVDASNLQRQIVHGTSEIGNLKVESARKRLLDVNPSIDVDVYHEPFLSANAMRISEPYDVIVDCTDNFPTRYLSNDLCVLTGKPNVFGAVFRFEGQASVFDARIGPCYRCLFPEPPPPDVIPTCSDAGVLGILPGTIGSIQATETIKIILGVGTSLAGKLLLYDALDMSFEQVSIKKNPKCAACGEHPSITQLQDYFQFCGVRNTLVEEKEGRDERDISAHELARMMENRENLVLIDVREPHELEISRIDGAVNIPLGQLAMRLDELDSTKNLIVFCKRGVRSRRAMNLLANAGFRHVKNLEGGINSWAVEVDPNLPIY